MADVRIWTARAHRLLSPIIQEIGRLYKAGQLCILLVPEQFTLQAERELMTRLKLTAFFTIQVLSPSRLSEHALSLTGSDGRRPLDGAGRAMAISRALEKCEDKLVFYRSSVNRRGFLEKLAALITDMKRGGLTPEALAAYASTLPNPEKLRDLALIYDTYEQVIAKGFSDGEDRLRYVASKLPESGLLEGQQVFVYGFDALPQQLTGLLCAMAPLCQGLTVGLVCDRETARDGELYLPVRQGIGRFTRQLEEQGLSVTVERLPNIPLASTPALQHLDEALYVYPPVLLAAPQESVFLSLHQSPFEEATAASRQILRLMQEGTELERIAVLYPDQNGYAFALPAALRDSGLPFYTDQKLPATSHGLVRFLLCALRAAASGYRSDDMLGMLKSGYAPLSFEECCGLENYAIAYGIDRSRWTKPFLKGVTEEQRQAMEALRLRLMEPVLRAREALVAARDTAASLSAVLGLLQDIHAYESLQKEEEALLTEGLTVRANQNSQVWATLLEMLDQLHSLSDGARIPLKYIAGRLECGLATVSLASLPPASHMLHVGTLGHSLAEGADVVFILGLNDGVLSRSTDSLLSPEERSQTEENTGAFLGMTDDSRSLLARLDLKRAMTLPQRTLCLSYAKTGLDGTALRPLTLLSTLQEKLLGKLPEYPVPFSQLPLSPTQALAQLSLQLRAYADGADASSLPPQWKALLIQLLDDPATAQQAMGLLKAAGHKVGSAPLKAGQARMLFGDETLSVSRLEQYGECPFKHFVNYGLRPQIVKPWKVEPLDRGNFYHSSLNNFASLAKHYPAYPHIPDEEAEALADAAISPLLDELMQGPMGDGAKSQADFERARQIVRRAALTVTRHLAAGQFQLFKTEAAFGYPGGMPPIVLTLADGREVMLRGKIDRVDRYQQGDSVFLRVIDYKSSRQDLDAARTWWGMQLQLLLYLDVCCASHENAQPAGAFYFYVGDPLVESDTDLRTVAEAQLRELLQLRGIALSDVEILTAMDGGELPVALPKMLDASGQVKPKSKTLDMQQLQDLLAHARRSAISLAEGIFSGDTAITPVRDVSRAACDYCDYRSICGFDPEADDAAFRDIPAMNMEGLREELSKK